MDLSFADRIWLGRTLFQRLCRDQKSKFSSTVNLKQFSETDWGVANVGKGTMTQWQAAW
jgi:hypothetical protein